MKKNNGNRFASNKISGKSFVPFKKDYSYVLFDLDGTLTDPKEGITKSVDYALKYFGIHEPSLDNLIHFIGPPLKESFMKQYGFNDEKAAAALEKYREYFSVTGIYENSVFPGIPELLRELSQKGITLAVATAKPTVFAEKILTHFEIKKYFPVVSGVTLENSMIPKEEIISNALKLLKVADITKAVMVGDRKHDIIGAKKVGIDSVGILYGYGTLSEISEELPTHIVESISGLKDLLL